jgi:hypothetical protein
VRTRAILPALFVSAATPREPGACFLTVFFPSAFTPFALPAEADLPEADLAAGLFVAGRLTVLFAVFPALLALFAGAALDVLPAGLPAAFRVLPADFPVGDAISVSAYVDML